MCRTIGCNGGNSDAEFCDSCLKAMSYADILNAHRTGKIKTPELEARRWEYIKELPRRRPAKKKVR